MRHALEAAVEETVSNRAYLVMASLAWTLKAWAALLLPEEANHALRHLGDSANEASWSAPGLRLPLKSRTGPRPRAQFAIRNGSRPRVARGFVLPGSLTFARHATPGNGDQGAPPGLTRCVMLNQLPELSLPITSIP
jgi:hypothetical protein